MIIIIWIAAILGALILLFVVLPIVVIAIRGTQPEGASVEFSCPRLTPAGEPFDLDVTVINLLDRPRLLHSVDFESSLLRGFTIEGIDPEPNDRSSGLGTTAHYFKRPIEPRGSITIRFRCRASSPGEYSGYMLAFVDSAHVKSIDRSVRLVVR